MSIYSDVLGACNAIESDLTTFLATKGAAAIFGYVGEAQSWPMNGQEIKPCAVIELPNLSHLFGGSGITGGKNVMQKMRFDVLNVGPTAKSSLQVMGLVCDKLVGWRPIITGV